MIDGKKELTFQEQQRIIMEDTTPVGYHIPNLWSVNDPNLDEHLDNIYPNGLPQVKFITMLNQLERRNMNEFN